MAPRSFGCRKIGAIVRGKMTAVTSTAECKRRFGINWKSATVTGTVVQVVTPPKGSGKQASVVVDWNIGSETKRKEVKIMNVRLEPPPIVTPMPNSAEETESEDEELVADIAIFGNNDEVTPPTDKAYVHGMEWSEKEIRLPLNGYIVQLPWKVRHVTGQNLGENQGTNGFTPFTYFTWMFPMSHLGSIVTLTNVNLNRNGKLATTASEILRFMGVIVLMSRYEFGRRRDLWATSSDNKYIPAPNFGKIMAQHRFHTLRANIRFSDAGSTDDDGEANRWGLVDDFVKAINQHREFFVTPSDLICVDESMSRWYGLGGDWIDVGLPTYRAIDRKPENGCEIKNSACGRSGIMLRMEIVKSPTEDAEIGKSSGLTHGAAVTKRLVEPWMNTNRIVCGDSYFASVNTAQALYDVGLRFIGVVKTAHKKFPAKYLGAKPVNGRGNWISMHHKDVSRNCDIAAVLWVDRERRYFVATAGNCLPGSKIYRERWRRVNDSTVKIITETDIPQIAETYYEAASQIDRHNRCRQHDLNLEKKFQVREWSIRVNTSLLAVCIVDAWLLYKGSQGSRDIMTPNQFYGKLAEQLIDNDYAVTGTRSRNVDVPATKVTASGIGPHLTPTTRKRKLQNGTPTNFAMQGRCKMCKNGARSSYVCSECPDVWLCHSKKGRFCFIDHFNQKHVHE